MVLDKKERWFKLHSSCIPVQGKEDSLIYDIEKQQLYPISNDHYELLQLCKAYSIPQLKEVLSSIEENVIDGFLEHFVEQHLGFYTNSPQSFPDLDLTWKSPSRISNAIIVLDEKSPFNLESIVVQLEDLGCDAVQLRLEAGFKLEEIEHNLKVFDDTRIRLIDLILPNEIVPDRSILFEWMKNYRRLGLVRLYAAPKDEILRFGDFNILLFKKDIRVHQEEVITLDRMTVNAPVFMEAQQHNTGLNKKVCIDALGNIKNYLTHDEIWGNVKQNTLKEIILQEQFQEKWFISNDQIETCCTCPFRYCCVSNSDIKEEKGKYYKLDACSIATC